MQEQLEQRQAGHSDLYLSTVGVGCWSFGGGDYWGPTDQRDVDGVVRRALDLGINYFDTAEVYNDGRSEVSLGKAIRGLPRDQVIIGTKVAPSNVYHDTLIEHCEASLRRLGTDYVDLYMIHWPVHPYSIQFFADDPAVVENPPHLEEAAEALLKLQAQGKIRHIGVSNFGVRWLDMIRSFGIKPAVNQLAYNLMSRAIEYEVLPYCREHGIGIVGYSVLMQGLLADLYPTLDDVPDLRRRTRHFDHRNSPLSRHGEDGAEPETRQALEALREAARELDLTAAEVAIAWTIHNPAITCAIAGARSTKKLDQNVRGALRALPASIKVHLDEKTRPLMDKLGNHCDYWESAENDRTR